MARLRDMVSHLMGKKKPIPPRGHAVLQQGDGRQLVIPQEGPFTIGRAREAEVRLDSDLVSRLHAQAKWEGGQLWLRDQSAHGTSVQDKPLPPEECRSVPVGAAVSFAGADFSLQWAETYPFSGKPAFLDNDGLLRFWPDGHDVWERFAFQNGHLQVREGPLWRSLAHQDEVGDSAVVDVGLYSRTETVWSHEVGPFRVDTLANGQLRVVRVVARGSADKKYPSLPTGRLGIPQEVGTPWLVERQACQYLGDGLFGHSFMLTNQQFRHFAANL